METREDVAHLHGERIVVRATRVARAEHQLFDTAERAATAATAPAAHATVPIVAILLGSTPHQRVFHRAELHAV